MPENFLPKVVTVFPLKVLKKLNFQFLIVHWNHPFCVLNIPPFLRKFNPQYFTKLKRWSCAKHRNRLRPIDICPPEEYIKNVGRPKMAVFFILQSKREPGECFPENKKSARWRKRFTNEMTLELSHLSPTIKQGSSLFGFKVCHFSTSLSTVSDVWLVISGWLQFPDASYFKPIK